MKRFTVPCDFNGVKYPFHVYVGEPHPKLHPLRFQSWWLTTIRGGVVPQEVMDSFERLHKISIESNVSFEDLCVHAFGEAKNHEVKPAENVASGTVVEERATQPAAEALSAEPPTDEEETAQQPSGTAETTENAAETTKLDGLPRTISLITGTLNNGGPFWCFVAVRTSRYNEFLAVQREGKLDLTVFTPFGEIIITGEGKGPPRDIIIKVAELYQTDPETFLRNVENDLLTRHEASNASENE